MSKYEIQVNTGECTGCLKCQLACSEHYTRAFNPAAARILVEVSGTDCMISFTEECNQCGICADYCFYGALVKRIKEAV